MKHLHYTKFFVIFSLLILLFVFYQRNKSFPLFNVQYSSFLNNHLIQGLNIKFDKNLKLSFRNKSLDLEDFVQQSLSLKQQNNGQLIYVTLINRAFLDFTVNWLCNTQNMDGVHESTLIACMEEETKDKLAVLWPKIRTTWIRIQNGSNESLFSEQLIWGHPDYVSFMALRSRLISVLIHFDVKFVLFETDAIWTKKAHNFLQSFIKPTTSKVESFSSEEPNNDESLSPSFQVYTPKKYESDQYNRTLCFSPLMVLDTSTQTSQFFDHMADILAENETLYDQDVLDDLCKLGYAGIHCRYFAYKDVADGYWFYLPDKYKKLYYDKPHIINNNFIVGVKHKIIRQALNGYWFLDVRKKYVCDQRLLEKMQLT